MAYNELQFSELSWFPAGKVVDNGLSIWALVTRVGQQNGAPIPWLQPSGE